MLKFIESAHTGVKQTFGKFTGLATPGLNVYIPFFQSITSVSNRIHNMNFTSRVKTKDNVFADMHIGVQVQVKPHDTEKAFFSLKDPKEQINTYVQNVIRSKVPGMKLDELFESQGEIGQTVKSNLDEKLSDYGWTIIDTLVNDIVPAQEVVDAMNEINASERLKHAAKNKADAEYIMKVREAEADRDRKILQGQGISGQRLAILKGYEQSVEDMSGKFGLSPKDIISFVLETQRFDMLENIGKSPNTKSIFVDHSTKSLRKDIMEANEINEVKE